MNFMDTLMYESSYRIVGLHTPKTAFGLLDPWKSEEILVAWRSLPQAREGNTAHIFRVVSRKP